MSVLAWGVMLLNFLLTVVGSQASHATSAFGIPVSCIVLRTLRITMTRVRMFLYFNVFMSLTSYFDVKYRY